MQAHTARSPTPAAMTSGDDTPGRVNVDGKKEKSKEASRRFRERKKANERALAVENAQLKEELEQMRQKLAGTHLNVNHAMDDFRASMRTAIDHLNKSLPNALLPSIQRVLEARRSATATATHLIRELKHIIPPIAHSEILLSVLLTWLRVSEAGKPEPEDPVEREIYHMFETPPAGAPGHVLPEDRKEFRRFLSANADRFEKVLDRRRRLRLLIEQAIALGGEVEVDDAWFHYACNPLALGIFRPEQMAGRVAWNDAHLPMLQDRFIGYRLDLSAPAAPAPAPVPPAGLKKESAYAARPTPPPPPPAAPARNPFAPVPSTPGGPSPALRTPVPAPAAASPLPSPPVLRSGTPVQAPGPAQRKRAADSEPDRAPHAPPSGAPAAASAPAPAGAGLAHFLQEQRTPPALSQAPSPAPVATPPDPDPDAAPPLDFGGLHAPTFEFFAPAPSAGARSEADGAVPPLALPGELLSPPFSLFGLGLPELLPLDPALGPPQGAGAPPDPEPGGLDLEGAAPTPGLGLGLWSP
eukprot:tig00000605_g2504.t1